MAPSAIRLAIDLSGSPIRVVEGSIGGTMRSGSAALPDSAASGGRVGDPAGVAHALKPLLARTEVTLTRALVAVSDALATFRILYLPAGATGKEVDAAIARELPFDPQRTSTKWLELESSIGGRVIYAAAWDKELLKNVTEAVKLAGVDATVVELKSASVARAVPVATCVVADLSTEPAELILIDRHLPQVWHSFSLRRAQGDDAAAALAAPLRSMLRFYRRRTDGDFGRAAPVYVSGEQALSSHALNELAGLIEQPVQPLPAPARIPPQVRHSTYLTCLGLLMRRAS
jgi:hypothetical protein